MSQGPPERWRGVVQWRTTRVAFVACDDSTLLALHDQAVPSFPFSRILPHRLFREELPVGTEVDSDRLPCRRPARRRRDRPAVAQDEFLSRLRRCAPAAASGELSQAIMTLGHALGSGTPSEIDAAGIALLGRGPGLTPQGDDVLLGLLAAGELAPPEWEVHRVPETVAAGWARRADQATTSISAALLSHAAHGAHTPLLHDLFSGARDQQLEEILAAVSAIGATTGPALLLGARLAADPSPRARPARRPPDVAR